MKISKKILGVALVLTMILNVFAVGAFAAFPDDTAVKLTISADKETYAAGDEVVLTFSEQVIAALGSMSIGGQYEIAYNNAVFTPFNAASDVLDDQGFKAIQAGYDAGISGVQLPGKATEPSALHDWNESICYQVGDDGTVFDATNKTDLFTVKLKIKSDAPDGTYTIGYNPAGYEAMNAFSNDGVGFGGLYGTDASVFGLPVANTYEYGTCTITVGEGGSTGPDQPTEINVAVKNLDPKVQWRAAGSSDLYIGFEGELSGFTKDQAATVIGSISELGIEFSSTDATLATSIKATTNVVYDFTADDAGVYKFRAVVRKAMTDADAAGTITHNLYARAFVKIGDKAPITASDIISTTIHDEYTEGVNNTMLTLAENLAAK